MNKLTLKSLGTYGLASLLLLLAPVYDATAADILYISDFRSRSVKAIDTSDSSLIATITDIAPTGVKVSPDGTRLYVLDKSVLQPRS